MLTINISFTSKVSTLKRIRLQKDLRRIFDIGFSHFDCPFKLVKVGDDSFFVMIDLSLTFSIRFVENVNDYLRDYDGAFVSSVNYNI